MGSFLSGLRLRKVNAPVLPLSASGAGELGSFILTLRTETLAKWIINSNHRFSGNVISQLPFAESLIVLFSLCESVFIVTTK